MDFAKLCRTYGIGLTGGIASGKSTVASILREKNFVVIDADQISRLAVAKGSEGLKEVVLAFGEDILNAAGEMDRVKMRSIVFADPNQRQRLEGIIHQRLGVLTAEVLRDHQLFDRPRFWFYEASLLFERDRSRDFKEVWVAHCPRPLQIARLMARDHCTAAEAEAMLAAQMDPEEKKRLANRTIDTDCDKGELVLRVEATLASMRS